MKIRKAIHRIKLIAPFCLAIYLTACNTIDNENKTVIQDFDQSLSRVEQLTFDTSVSGLKLSQYVKKINYIPLRNINDAFIGEISKIESDSNVICVLDRRYSKAVFVFNKNGDLLFKKKANSEDLIGVDKISDITIDKFNQRVVVFANEEQKIISFDLKSGKLAGVTKLNDFFTKVRLVDKDHYMVLRDGLARYKGVSGEFRVCVIHFNGQVINKYFNSALNTKTNVGAFYASDISNGRIILSRMLSDTLWEFRNNNILPVASLPNNFINTSFLRSATTKNEADSAIVATESHYISSDIFETDSIITFQIKGDNSINILIWNKTNGKKFLHKYVINDIDYVPLSMPIFWDNRNITSVISIPMLQQYYSLVQRSNPNDKSLVNVKAIIDQFKDQTNPIVVELLVK
jgi:hypothetical protein